GGRRALPRTGGGVVGDVGPQVRPPAGYRAGDRRAGGIGGLSLTALDDGPAGRTVFDRTQRRGGTMDQHELLRTAERHLPGAWLGMMPLPPELRMVLVRGEGSRVYDGAGGGYLDSRLGTGPLLLGHAHPAVVAAVQRQAALGSTFFALNEPAVRLAEQLALAVPCGEAVRFQTTGSEATFAALRLARAATRRDRGLTFDGG